jgi:hypothetical protein
VTLDPDPRPDWLCILGPGFPRQLLFSKAEKGRVRDKVRSVKARLKAKQKQRKAAWMRDYKERLRGIAV